MRFVSYSYDGQQIDKKGRMVDTISDDATRLAVSTLTTVLYETKVELTSKANKIEDFSDDLNIRLREQG